MLDSIPMKQIDIDMKTETPDASMLSIKSNIILHETKPPQIPQDLMAQLQANDVLQISNLKEILESACPKETIELFALKRAPEINSVQGNDPLNFFDVDFEYTIARDSDGAEERSSVE